MKFWIFFWVVNAILGGLLIKNCAALNDDGGEDAATDTMNIFALAAAIVAFTAVTLLVHFL